jgi:transcriptional regulator with GAF, ATPase, and Fis domain
MLRARLEQGSVRLDLLHEALRLSLQLRNEEFLAEARYLIGRTHHDIGRLSAASRNYHESMAIVRKIWEGVPEELRDGYLKTPVPLALHRDIARLRLDMKTASEGAGMARSRAAAPSSGANMGTKDLGRRKLEAAVALLKDENRNLLKLIAVNKGLNSQLSLPELLDAIVDAAMDLTRADAGYLVLKAERDGLNFEAAKNLENTRAKSPDTEISSAIARRVMQTGQSIVTSNAQEDESLRALDSVRERKLTSMVCAPLKLREAVAGAIYIENRLAKGAFTQKDAELLEAFAEQAAAAIENARLCEEGIQRHLSVERARVKVLEMNRRLEDAGRMLQERVQRQAVQLAELRRDVLSNTQELALKHGYDSIIGRSPKMQTVVASLHKNADSTLPVLIEGESGTGKELVARAIHFNGPRRTMRFAAENCAALADSALEAKLLGHVRGGFPGADSDRKGLLETADGGTIFLDEIGDVSPEMQEKLLRIMETGEFLPLGAGNVRYTNIRIISASGRAIKELVAKGAFREDLLDRLGAFTVHLPPLRERMEDIPLLVEHFLGELARDTGTPRKQIDGGVIELLMQYPWPGNVRELRNAVLGVATLSDRQTLGASDFVERLPFTDRRKRPREPAAMLSIDDYIRGFILDAQDRLSDIEIAGALGLSRKTIWEKRKKFGIPR